MAISFAAASSEYLEGSAPVTAAPLTVASWFNVNDITTTYSLGGLMDASVANSWFILLLAGAVGGDPVRFFSRSSAGFGQADTSSGYSANTWQHACGVEVSATERYSYLDGGSQGSDTTNITPTNIDTLAIGAIRDSTPSGYMDGLQADFAVWNAALTQTEVQMLAAGFSPLFVRPQNLVFYDPLVRTLTEDIIGAQSLTVGGTPTVGDHPPIIMPSSNILQFPPAAVATGTTLQSSLMLSGVGI